MTQRSKLWIAAGVAAATIPSVGVAVLWYLRSTAKNSPRDELPSEVQQWTSQHVIAWLQSIDVSDDAVAAFRNSAVDGSVLPMLQEVHLREMGVRRVGDRLKLVSELRRLVGAPLVIDNETGSEVRLVSPMMGEEVTVSREASHPSNAAVVGETVSRLKGLYGMLGSDEFLAAPAAEQRRRLHNAQAELQLIITQVDALPEEQRQTVLPATERLQELVTRALLATDPSSEGRWKNNVVQIAEMLKSLRASIGSEAAAANPKPTARLIRGQIVKIRETVLTFPEAYQKSLLTACALLETEVHQRLEGAPPAAVAVPQAVQHPSATSLSSPEKSRASARYLVERLRHIMDSVRSDAHAQLPLTEQKRFLQKSIEDVKGLQHEAQYLPQQEQPMVLPIATGVLEMLLQAQQLTEARGAQAERQVAEEDSRAADIIDILRQLSETIRSEQFARSNPDQREVILAQMQSTLTQVGPLLASLRDEHRQQVEPLYHKMVNFVSKSITLIQVAKAKRARPPREQSQITELEDDEAGVVPSATAEEEAESTAPEDELFPEVVAKLKLLFGTLSSDEFRQLPLSERTQSAMALAKQLEVVKTEITELPPVAQDSLRELVASLDSLLQRLTAVSSSAAVAAARATATTVPQQTPEDLAMKIVNAVDGFMRILNSEQFAELGPARQSSLARSILRKLEPFSAAVETLPNEYKEQVGPIVAHLRSSLEGLLNDAEQHEELLNSAEMQDATSELFDLAKKATTALREGDGDLSVAALETMMSILEALDQVPLEQCANEETLNRRISIRRDFQEALAEQLRKTQDKLSAQVAGQTEEQDEDAEEEEEDECGGEGGATTSPGADGVEPTEEDAEAEREKAEVSPALVEPSEGEAVSDEGQALVDEVTSKDGEETSAAAPSPDGQPARLPPSEEAGTPIASHGSSSSLRPLDPLVELDDEEVKRLTKPPFAKIVSTLLSLRHELHRSTYKQPEDLRPFFMVLNEVLRAAESEGLRWRDDRATAYLVKVIIAEVQRIQATLTDSTASLLTTLTDAADYLSQGTVGTLEELAPYIELVNSAKEMGDRLSLEEVEAISRLQDLVLGISRKLAAESTSPQPEEKPPAATIEESRAPPLARSGSGSPHYASDPNVSADQQVLTMLRQIAVKVAELPIKQPLDVAPYLTMVERIRREKSPSDEIQRAVGSVEALIHAKLAEIGKTTEDCHRSLVESKRDSMRKMREIMSHPLFARMPAEQQQSAVAKAERLMTTLSQDEAVVLEEDVKQLKEVAEKVARDTDEELVPGSLSSDLGLIPRIVERLQQDDFVENTSVFEIESIGKLLRRLSEAAPVRLDQEMTKVVRIAQRQFDDRLHGYDGPTKDTAEVQCKLQVLAMPSETERGQKVLSFLLVSPEEEGYSIAESGTQQFDTKPLPVAPASPEEKETWANSSEALLVVLPASDSASSQSATSLSELAALAEALADQHGFNVNSIATGATRETILSAVEEVLERSPARFFFYVLSSAPSRKRVPHQIEFEDGSVLEYREIQEACAKAADIAVIAHDAGQGFELSSVKGRHLSPLVIAQLTDAAFAISNCSRCWLYDGLFTPLVLELLVKEEPQRLCVEDLVNHAIRVLSCSSEDGCGTYTSDVALGATLFDVLEVSQ